MELTTSRDFAQWFTSLDERTAENVATTLEVVAQLGPEREAPGSSEWLTWYEHPSLSERLRALSPNRPPWPLDPAVGRAFDDWGAFNGYAKRVVKQLESRAFAARLAQLTEREAAAVTGAVARIKKAVTRRQLAFSQFQIQKRLYGMRAPTPAEAAELARFSDLEEIRDSYLSALAAAGFEIVDVPAHSAALREIASRTPAPGFRLLYGVDAPRRRALVAIGEPLDRSFYGDSVRRAEQVWQEFLGADPQASLAAGPR